jgi:hypothetical protein
MRIVNSNGREHRRDDCSLCWIPRRLCGSRWIDQFDFAIRSDLTLNFGVSHQLRRRLVREYSELGISTTSQLETKRSRPVSTLSRFSRLPSQILYSGQPFRVRYDRRITGPPTRATRQSTPLDRQNSWMSAFTATSTHGHICLASTYDTRPRSYHKMLLNAQAPAVIS